MNGVLYLFLLRYCSLVTVVCYYPIESYTFCLLCFLSNKTLFKLLFAVSDGMLPWEKDFMGLTAYYIRQLAFQLNVKNNIEYSLANGKKWLKNIHKRHPNLSWSKPQYVIIRTKGFTEASVDAFFLEC